MAELSGIFGRPFAEQVAAWRLRLSELRPTQAWTDVEPQFHDRGFMVAGATKAELLADLAAAVEKAIRDRRGLEEFRGDFRAIVEKHGWHGWTGEGSAKGEAWRTRVIYQTNMATTYAAGRRAQLIAAGFKIWVYKHGNAREPRPQHLAWDGIALVPDHPFWAAHCPPNGWGCTCRIRGANGKASIRAVGGDPDKELPEGWDRINAKTGTPDGIDKGWDHAPGASNDHLAQTIAGRAEALPGQIGDDLKSYLTQLRDGGRLPAVSPSGPLRSWQDMAPSTDLTEIDRMVVDLGLAFRTGSNRFRPEGYYELVRASAEVLQRFDLPPLRYFGSASDYPFQPPMPDEVDMPPALYDWKRRSIAFAVAATDADKVRRLLSLPSAPRSETEWHERLRGAAPEVRQRAGAMRFPGWLVEKSVSDIARHELGHHFHFHYEFQINRLIQEHGMLEHGWSDLVSEYGGQNAFEFFAEAFTLYMQGSPGRSHRLHPALLEFFLKLDRG